MSRDQLVEKANNILAIVERAFDTAVNEPKITSREFLLASNSATLDKSGKSRANIGSGNDIFYARTIDFLGDYANACNRLN